MRLQRDFYIRRLGRLLRWNAVEHHAGSEFGNFGSADDGDGAAETEAGQADLGAVPAKILHGAAHRLRGGVHEIQRVHFLGGGVHVVIRHHLAVIEVGCQRVEAGRCEAVAQPLDLLRKPPPFLDHDHTRRIATLGVCQITAGVLAVRALERNAGTHEVLR